ncbi:hypothetical protein RyT2_12700 [Pseudolactococcus yaeyamensis]
MYGIEKELEKDYEKFIRITINFILLGVVFVLLMILSIPLKNQEEFITIKNQEEYNYTVEFKEQYSQIKISENGIKPKKEILCSIFKKKLNQKEFELLSNSIKQFYIAEIDKNHGIIENREGGIELKQKIDYILKEDLSIEGFENLSENKKVRIEKIKNNYLIKAPYEKEETILYFIAEEKLLNINIPTKEMYGKYLEEERKKSSIEFLLLVVSMLGVLYTFGHFIHNRYWSPYTIFKVDDLEYVLLKKMDDKNILATKYYQVKNRRRTKIVSEVFKFNETILNNQLLRIENINEISKRRNISMYNDSIIIKYIFRENGRNVLSYLINIFIVLMLFIFWIIGSIFIISFLYYLWYLLQQSISLNVDFDIEFAIGLWLIFFLITSLMIIIFYIIPIRSGKKENEIQKI